MRLGAISLLAGLFVLIFLVLDSLRTESELWAYVWYGLVGFSGTCVAVTLAFWSDINNSFRKGRGSEKGRI